MQCTRNISFLVLLVSYIVFCLCVNVGRFFSITATAYAAERVMGDFSLCFASLMIFRSALLKQTRSYSLHIKMKLLATFSCKLTSWTLLVLLPMQRNSLFYHCVFFPPGWQEFLIHFARYWSYSMCSWCNIFIGYFHGLFPL